MDQIESIKKKKKKKREEREPIDSANGHNEVNDSSDSLKVKKKKKKHSPDLVSTFLKVNKKNEPIATPSSDGPVIDTIKKKKNKEEKLTNNTATPSRVTNSPSKEKITEPPTPKKKSKKDKQEPKKKKDKDRLKQTTLTESFIEKKSEGKKNSKKKKKTDIQTPEKSAEKAETQTTPSKSPSKSTVVPPNKDIKNKSKKAKKRKEGKVEKEVGKKRNLKMDVEKANNNQMFNFGQPIDISDNSSDSNGLKIATNDDDDTSELSSEYDSSDSEHIMKNIKSFNKKGASKSSAKKDDEPPPPKVRAKIYSSSDDENDDDADEDDEDEADIKEEDDEERMEDELGDDEMPKTDDPEDAFLNGWTKADVKHLLSKIQFEIPKNDNIKASTRVKQLNWENIKFNSYTAAQCLEKWKTIEKKIRGYRILQELLTDAQQWLEQPWTDFYKGNKKKYMRHPEMPKKPLTSYMIFYLKKKDSIAKEFPLLTLTDLSKVIAERFNKLAPNKKAKYNEMALQMKEDYQAKMKKFAVEHPAEMTRMYNNGGRRTRATQNAMPGWSGGNKPLPPVRLFIEDKMKVHTGDLDANLPELQAQYKEKWKSMTAKKKLPWIRWAYDSELKYIEELKAYQARNPHFDVPKYKSVLLKEERSLLEKMQGKPDKPPPSAYLLFSSVMLRDPNLQKLTPKERMQETARLWKNVPKVEKEGYQEKVKHLANVYKLEYASYLESLPEDKRKEELANNMPKRRAKSSSSNSAKKLKTEIKSSDEKPRLPLEELVKKQPVPPPKDAYALFCQDYKDYPEKEIRKSWDALLEAPRNKLEARVEKLKQQYILDMRKFLKSLDPEDLQIYSAYKAGLDHQSPDVNLSESEGSDEEEEEEEEESEDEEVSEEEQKVDISAVKLESPKKSVSNIKTEPIKKEESSSSDEEEEEGKTAGKSSSSSSSSESSSEEGSSSTSGSSSSSEDEDAGAF